MTVNERLLNCIDILDKCIEKRSKNNTAERKVLAVKGNEELWFNNQKECAYALQVSVQAVSQALRVPTKEGRVKVKGYDLFKHREVKK